MLLTFFVQSYAHITKSKLMLLHIPVFYRAHLIWSLMRILVYANATEPQRLVYSRICSCNRLWSFVVICMTSTKRPLVFLQQRRFSGCQNVFSPIFGIHPTVIELRLKRRQNARDDAAAVTRTQEKIEPPTLMYVSKRKILSSES